MNKKFSCIITEKASLIFIFVMCTLIILINTSFVFANNGPSTRPVISGVSHEVLTNSVKISFDTDISSFGAVEYWLAGSDKQEVGFSDSNGNNDYEVELSGLSQGLYLYRVRACSNADLCRESDVEHFIFGDDTTPPSVDDITCPVASRDRFVMIGGTTKPLSEISLYQDGDYKFRVHATETGFFTIDRAPLTNQDSTEIKLVITDISGNTNEKVCVISYDSSPPNLQVEEIPSATNQNRVEVDITVDKPVELKIYKFEEGDQEPPRAPRNLRLDSVSSESVSIAWDAPESGESSIVNYVVYRGNIPIASTSRNQRTFEDVDVISGRAYTYRVKAVDDSCVDGELSELLDVQVEPGNYFSRPPEELNFNCPDKSPITRTNIIADSLEYSGPIDVRDGENRIVIIAEDAAGNVASKEINVFVDRTSPSFVRDNLDEFSDGSVFSPFVTITGEISKPSTINITLNEGRVGERVHIFDTSDDGSFSRQVDLVRSWESLVEVGTDPESASIDFSSREWVNTIKITASDSFGNVATRTGTITYGVCADGTGNDWQITITSDSVTPNVFVPRHLLEGIAVLGFSYELEYRGPSDGPVTADRVRVEPLSMSQFAARNYNLNWIQNRPIPVNHAGDFGYAQLRLRAQKPKPDGTMLENEQAIAETNKGNCLGSMVAFGAEGGTPWDSGCVKIPLVIEVDYRDNEGNQLTQKECIDFSIRIDSRSDVRDIPGMTPFLEGSVSILERIANVTGTLIERLQPPMRVTTGVCLGSYVAIGVSSFNEVRSCILNGALLHAGDFEFERTESGYAINTNGLEGDELDRANALQSCFDARVSMEEAWQFSRNVCRRMMCGSIPTFDNYVQRQQGIERFFDNINPIEFLDRSASYCHNRKDVGGSIYAPENYFPLNFLDEKLKHEDTVGSKFGPQERVVANFMHSPGMSWAEAMADEWCEEEYYYEYKPSCWLKNPYKESLCMAYALNKDVSTSSLGSQDARSAIGPICDPDGIVGMAGSALDTVRDMLNFCSAGSQEPYGRLFGEDFFYIVPQGNGSKEVYVLESEGIAFSTTQQESGIINVVEMDQNIELRAQNRLTLNNFADRAFLDRCDRSSAVDACQACASGISGNPCCPEFRPGRQIPPSMAGEICRDLEPTSAKVIQPTSSFIDSTACVCLSGVNAHLSSINRVTSMLSDCFKTIAETGDGSAGICQQLVSTYVCDLIYSAIGCFTNYPSFSFPENEVDADGLTFRNIGSALSLAGRRTQNRISGEYGDDAIFRHFFEEKNFVNSACMWALYGEWPSNFFESAFDAAVDAVPIQPIMSCAGTRRFQTFDSVSGVATHVYDVAASIIPGAPDTRYRIELLCSTESGSDCQSVGEIKTFDITSNFGSGTRVLSRSQSLSEQAFIIVDEGRDSNQGRYRYDKIRVSATYTNNDGATVTDEQVCNLRSVGGEAPAFCGFDLMDLRFSCRVVGQGGSIYFSQTPSARRSVIYLDESTSERTVEFDTFSIRSLSRPGEPRPEAMLRISVADNNGRPFTWTDNGRAEQLYTMHADLVRFGPGADNPNLNPRFVVDKLDAHGGGTGQCSLHESGQLAQFRSINNCVGNFEAIEFSIAENVITYELGRYSNTFTSLESQRSLDAGNYKCGVDSCTIEFNEAGTNFIIDNVPKNRFPFVVRNIYSGTTLNRLDVKFALIDGTGSVITEHTVPITLRSGTRADHVDRDLDDLQSEAIDSRDIGFNQVCTLREGCGCGATVCQADQRCCAHSVQASGVGYCISGGSNTRCDNQPPNLRDIDISAERFNSFVRFRINEVKDESDTSEFSSPSVRVFVDLRKEGTSDTIEAERSDTFTAQAESPIQQSGGGYTIPYPEFVINANVQEDGCYDVFVSAIDKAGNFQPMPQQPNGILLVGGDRVEFKDDDTCAKFNIDQWHAEISGGGSGGAPLYIGQE